VAGANGEVRSIYNKAKKIKMEAPQVSSIEEKNGPPGNIVAEI